MVKSDGGVEDGLQGLCGMPCQECPEQELCEMDCNADYEEEKSNKIVCSLKRSKVAEYPEVLLA